MTTGQSIRHHRMKRGLTQMELARRIGVSHQAVSKWEKDAGMPDAALLAPLARALGTTTDELLRFGERYQEFEDWWGRTLQTFGDNPEKLVEVSLAALKEFPHDWSFLYRTAVSQWRIGMTLEDLEERKELIGQAAVYARLLYEQDKQNSSAVWIYSEIRKELERLWDKEKREE